MNSWDENTTVAVRIPYNLTRGEVKLEEGPNRGIADEDVKFVMEETSEFEFDRIITSYVVLRTTYPSVSMGKCLRTAIVWERG